MTSKEPVSPFEVLRDIKLRDPSKPMSPEDARFTHFLIHLYGGTCIRCGSLNATDALCDFCREYLDSFFHKPKHDPRQGSLF